MDRSADEKSIGKNAFAAGNCDGFGLRHFRAGAGEQRGRRWRDASF
jgi:heme oxygenase